VERRAARALQILSNEATNVIVACVQPSQSVGLT
jgi:hypothetical protein